MFSDTQSVTHVTSSAVSSSHCSALGEGEEPQLIVLVDRARPLDGGSRHSLAQIEQVVLQRGPRRAARRVLQGDRPTLLLALPDRHVSSRHAVIERVGSEWHFSDCGSRNGSRVNRQITCAATLADGDVLEVGRTLLRFRSHVHTPKNAERDLDAAALQGMAQCLATLLPRLGHDLEMLARVAHSGVDVLLLGETGTGKEVLARAIHERSARAGAFVPVNCGALPAALVESLLFGHNKGAFSGAVRDELGFVRAAHGGTLFLDEIAELPKPSQATLLRVLQQREVAPLGAPRPVSVDVHVIAATHQPLEALVLAGEFRDDLFARLSAFTYALPALRDRIDDVGVLLASILAPLLDPSGVAPVLCRESAYALLEHDWPHNVRELAQKLKVAVSLSSEGRIELEGLSRPTGLCAEPASSQRAQCNLSPEEQELYEKLMTKLSEHRGNLTRVGESMGKRRTQIQRWVRKFAIDVSAFRD